MPGERLIRACQYLHLPESEMCSERLRLIDQVAAELNTTFPPVMRYWYAQTHAGHPVQWEWDGTFIPVEEFREEIFQLEGRRFLALWHENQGVYFCLVPLDDPADQQVYVAEPDFGVDGRVIPSNLKVRNASFEEFMISVLAEYVMFSSQEWQVTYSSRVTSEKNLPALKHLGNLDTENELAVEVRQNLLFGDAGVFFIRDGFIRYLSCPEESSPLAPRDSKVCDSRITDTRVAFAGAPTPQLQALKGSGYTRLKRASILLGFPLDADEKLQEQLQLLEKYLGCALPEGMAFWYTRSHQGFPVAWEGTGERLTLFEFNERSEELIEAYLQRSDFGLVLWLDSVRNKRWKASLSFLNYPGMPFAEPSVSLLEIGRNGYEEAWARTFQDFVLMQIVNVLMNTTSLMTNTERLEIKEDEQDIFFDQFVRKAQLENAVLIKNSTESFNFQKQVYAIIGPGYIEKLTQKNEIPNNYILERITFVK